MGVEQQGPGGDPRLAGARFRRLTLAAAGLAALAVAVTATVPDARLAYRGLHLQSAVETALAFIALLAAYLLAGRPTRGGSRADLFLAWGFSILALTNLGFGAIPGSLGERDTAFLTWAAALGAAAGAACLAWAGMAAARPVRMNRPAVAFNVVPAVVVGAAALAALALASVLSPGLSPGLAPSRSPLFEGHLLLNVLHALIAVLFAAASLAALRLVERRGDELVGWLAAGTALSAGGWASYLLLPVSSGSWVAVGDALRLGFYLLVLAGAMREIGSYRRRVVAAAIDDERRRIARDVHDGLAQDLAYISTAIEDRNAGTLPELREAARRATLESRALLDALAGREQPAEAELHSAAAQLAGLHGVHLRYAMAPGLSMTPPQLQCLERVLIEAIRNAARHGSAQEVEVGLGRTGGDLRLRVHDNGRGFDPGHVPDGRFGLSGMRDRVEALGGRLEIESTPGAGTTIEVTLP